MKASVSVSLIGPVALFYFMFLVFPVSSWAGDARSADVSEIHNLDSNGKIIDGVGNYRDGYLYFGRQLFGEYDVPGGERNADEGLRLLNIRSGEMSTLRTGIQTKWPLCLADGTLAWIEITGNSCALNIRSGIDDSEKIYEVAKARTWTISPNGKWYGYFGGLSDEMNTEIDQPYRYGLFSLDTEGSGNALEVYSEDINVEAYKYDQHNSFPSVSNQGYMVYRKGIAGPSGERIFTLEEDSEHLFLSGVVSDNGEYATFHLLNSAEGRRAVLQVIDLNNPNQISEVDLAFSSIYPWRSVDISNLDNTIVVAGFYSAYFLDTEGNVLMEIDMPDNPCVSVRYDANGERAILCGTNKFLVVDKNYEILWEGGGYRDHTCPTYMIDPQLTTVAMMRNDRIQIFQDPNRTSSAR